jgi:HD-GYP domain-containing protein (c-di-GMP phosphodiesterase class II)
MLRGSRSWVSFTWSDGEMSSSEQSLSLSSVRLSEMVATLSLASDLGMGHPMERALRQTLISMRLASSLGVQDGIRAATYYTSLLTWVGCATDTSDLAQLFGDETELFADTHDDDLDRLAMAVFVARHLGRGGSPMRRVGLVGKFFATAGKSVQQVMMSHCQATAELAARLGLGAEVQDPLLQAFERWDRKGVPGSAGGTDLTMAARLVHLANNVEFFERTAGTEAALAVARHRRGTQFDPTVVDCFCEQHREILEGLDEIAAWDEVIALDPRLGLVLTDEQLDRALEAFGDFADLKSTFLVGHSRGVAALADEAAGALGLRGDERTTLRRAGLVHDIGVIGVTSTVWDAPRRWSLAQQERARTHPYLAERMLAHLPAIAPVGQCASMHHERLDGTGYPHGLRGEAIPVPARILAAADVYQALRSPRPHRDAMSPDAATATLRDEVRDGRLDGEAVNAVLGAAGHRIRRRAELPAGLTPREAEIVVRVARGLSNPQIAADLTVSRKTVSSHLEHIYTKLGVSTRTEAALFAMRQGLFGEVTGSN